MESIPLNAIQIGKQAQVYDLAGGEIMCKKLMEMGFNKGAVVNMVKNDTGALIIKLGETKLVLGRGMAQKVFVREI